MEKIENVVIIGGGPSGLSASLYLARAGLEPLVVAGSPPGGQLMLTTEVENFPGIKKIMGPDLVTQMREQTLGFGTRFIDENVVKITLGYFESQVASRESQVNNQVVDSRHISATNQHLDYHKIILGSGEELAAKTILIATGASAKWLDIPSETRLRGRGVSACATCDGFFFKNKVVGVVGGGDTAMEEALTLTNFASHVHLFHRRDTFRASQIMVDRVVKHEKITIHYNVAVEEVLGENKVEGVKLQGLNGATLNENKVELQGLFIAIGHTPATSFLDGTGIQLDSKGHIIDRQTYYWHQAVGNPLSSKFPDYNDKRPYRHETNVPDIFTSGDVVDSIYRQAVTASGRGVEAALEIEWLLRMEK